MKQLTAQQKHDILIHCEHRRQGETEVDIAALHGAVVSRRTMLNWRSRWNHTHQSLERREGSGAAPILTPSEISRHIRAPILAANRAHRAIHYPDVLQQVRTKTGKKIALRTLQQYGKEKCQIKERTTHKRTRAECECEHTSCVACACALHVYAADSDVQCLLLPVKRSPSCVANSNANASDTSSSSMRLHSVSVPLHCAH